MVIRSRLGLRLDDLRMHSETAFAEIAAKHASIIFVDGDDMFRGELMQDPALGWLGDDDRPTAAAAHPSQKSPNPSPHGHFVTESRKTSPALAEVPLFVR